MGVWNIVNRPYLDRDPRNNCKVVEQKLLTSFDFGGVAASSALNLSFFLYCIPFSFLFNFDDILRKHFPLFNQLHKFDMILVVSCSTSPPPNCNCIGYAYGVTGSMVHRMSITCQNANGNYSTITADCDTETGTYKPPLICPFAPSGQVHNESQVRSSQVNNETSSSKNIFIYQILEKIKSVSG